MRLHRIPDAEDRTGSHKQNDKRCHTAKRHLQTAQAAAAEDQPGTGDKTEHACDEPDEGSEIPARTFHWRDVQRSGENAPDQAADKKENAGADHTCDRCQQYRYEFVGLVRHSLPALVGLLDAQLTL